MQVVQPDAERDAQILNRAMDVVVAYVANNPVQASDLPGLMQSVHATFARLANPGPKPDKPEFEKPSPSAIRRSITPGALISFIDGKPYQTLKRHLTKNGLDIEGYRARYGLPLDYPSTSANYSATRAEPGAQHGPWAQGEPDPAGGSR